MRMQVNAQDYQSLLNELREQFKLNPNFVERLIPLVQKIFDAQTKDTLRERLVEQLYETCKRQQDIETHTAEASKHCHILQEQMALFNKNMGEVLMTLEAFKTRMQQYQHKLLNPVETNVSMTAWQAKVGVVN